MGSCTEELCPSFRTSESDGVWNREGMQEELQEEQEGEQGEEEEELGRRGSQLSGATGCRGELTCQVRRVHERRCSEPWAEPTP